LKRKQALATRFEAFPPGSAAQRATPAAAIADSI